MNAKRGTYVRTTNLSREWRRFVDLTAALVVREFKGLYRRSVLGPAWALLQPLIYLAIFMFLRGMFKIPSDGVPYVIFAYSALVPWTFFANAVTRCAPSVYSNAALVKKIAIPREVFPLAGMLTSFVDFVIASTILVAMMLWFRVPVGPALLWVPLLLALTMLLALGTGLLVSAMGTYKRDIIFAIPFLMQVWMLATPVMYPSGQVPERWRFLFDINPMAGLIEGFRSVLVKNTAPDLGLLAISVAGIVVVWLVGLPLFRSVSQYFADVL
jgi:lipopolysaccharide transport system permease protein